MVRVFIAAQNLELVWLVVVQVMNMSLVAAPRAVAVATDMSAKLLTLENDIARKIEQETGVPPSEAPITLDAGID